jgi:putative transposase
VSAFVSDETTGRCMPPTLSPGEQGRLLALERKKARQVRWARRHNGGRYSRRLRRTVGKIAGLRARQARRRLDFTHKLTTDLAKNHGWVAVEDLNVKGMTRTARGTVAAPGSRVAQKAGLNRGILDNIPGERRRQLEYKAPRYGSQVRPVPAPRTSQRCSSCGAVDPRNRPGCGREFACVACGHADHADRNAAVNIFNLAEGRPASQYASITPVVARPRTGSRTRTAKVPA